MTDPFSEKPEIMPAAAENALFRKISWRLLPFLFLLFVVAYLDRVNVGFARLQMNADLGFSDTVYGLGAGMFFVGYFLFEIPSNLILYEVGARRWIARIIMLWGLISAATLWVDTPASFYAIRFLLGLGEAGFYPGVIYYLTQWYPSARRAQAIAWFMTAVPIAGLLGGPLSGWIMTTLDGVYGLRGWQWLFVAEGLPAVVLGVLAWWWLEDSPSKAPWLNRREKTLLLTRLSEDDAYEAGPIQHEDLSAALTSLRIWGMTLLYFLLVMGLYGISFWMPQIVHDLDKGSYAATGMLTAIPYLVAAFGTVIIGISSDRLHERRWHLVGCAMAGALGFVGTMLLADSLTGSLAALSLAALGVTSAFAVFWPLPAAILSGRAAAGGIALINSVGNLGGYTSPAALGWLKDTTGQMASGLLLIAAALLGAAVLVLLLTHKPQK